MSIFSCFSFCSNQLFVLHSILLTFGCALVIPHSKVAVSAVKAAFHDTDIHRHPRDDPRDDVGVGVVECGLYGCDLNYHIRLLEGCGLSL